jgi:hypothetical protein
VINSGAQRRHCWRPTGAIPTLRFLRILPPILWEEILKRFPPIEVVERPKRAYSNLIHGITEMKVRIPT